jgi:hypothetical protein
MNNLFTPVNYQEVITSETLKGFGFTHGLEYWNSIKDIIIERERNEYGRVMKFPFLQSVQLKRGFWRIRYVCKPV